MTKFVHETPEEKLTAGLKSFALHLRQEATELPNNSPLKHATLFTAVFASGLIAAINEANRTKD